MAYRSRRRASSARSSYRRVSRPASRGRARVRRSTRTARRSTRRVSRRAPQVVKIVLEHSAAPGEGMGGLEMPQITSQTKRARF